LLSTTSLQNVQRRLGKVVNFDLNSNSISTTNLSNHHANNHNVTNNHANANSSAGSNMQSAAGGGTGSNSNNGSGSIVKRQRTSAEVSAQNVTIGIQHGVSKHDRREAMYNACAAFDHGVQIAHDDEVRVGADTAIFKHLTFLLYKRSALLLNNKKLDTKKSSNLRKRETGDGYGYDGGNKRMKMEHGHGHAGDEIERRDRAGSQETSTSLSSQGSPPLTSMSSPSLVAAIGASSSSTTAGGVSASTTTTSAHTNTHTHIMSEEEEDLLEEISTTIAGLEMVLRCSAECISVSFARIGEEFLPIIMDLLTELLDQRIRLADEEMEMELEERKERKAQVQGETLSGFQLQPEHVLEQRQDTEHGSASMLGPLSASISNVPMNDTHMNQCETGSNGSATMPIGTSPLTTSKVLHSSDPGPATTEADKISAAAESEARPSSCSKFKFSCIPRSAGDAILKTGTKIVGHFARVGSLTSTLAQTPRLLSTLQNVVAANSHRNSHSIPSSSGSGRKKEIVPIEAKLNSLWIIANLACCAENMISMAQHPGLVDTIVEIASHPNADDEDEFTTVMDFLLACRSRSIAVRAILNLSWAHENKIPFAQHGNLVNALLYAASQRHSCWTGNGKGVSLILMQSRRHAAGALRNLAAAPRRYKRRLCRYNDGCTFLETLAEIAKYDPDDQVRDKIHATLFNLVSADTAKMFVEKQGVLDVIVQTATGTGNVNNADSMNMNTNVGTSVGGGDESDEKSKGGDADCSKSMAIQILQSLEGFIPEDEEDYEVLRPVLCRFDSQVGLNKSTSRLAVCNANAIKKSATGMNKSMTLSTMSSGSGGSDQQQPQTQHHHPPPPSRQSQ